MAAPNGSSATTPASPVLPGVIKRQYSFTDFSVNNPTTPEPGNRIDAEYDRTNNAVNALTYWCQNINQVLSLPSGPLVAGADTTALEDDYAAVAQAWAEYMPDTIPPNILAVMNITGDHWSSRWWSNRAAQQIQNWQNSLPPAPTNTARYVYVATLNQTLFHGPDRNSNTLQFDPTVPQRTQVFRRGLLLTPTDDYNEAVANQITLVQPAQAGDIVQIFVFTLPQAFTIPPFTSSGSFTPPTGANYTLFINAGSATTLTLGAGRVVGQLITIKDGLGTAGATPIVIQAAATVDNNPTYTLYSDFASLTLVWMGTMWGTL
jgi:hypothetical protein